MNIQLQTELSFSVLFLETGHPDRLFMTTRNVRQFLALALHLLLIPAKHSGVNVCWRPPVITSTLSVHSLGWGWGCQPSVGSNGSSLITSEQWRPFSGFWTKFAIYKETKTSAPRSRKCLEVQCDLLAVVTVQFLLCFWHGWKITS